MQLGQPNRWAPQGPVQAYETFHIRTPRGPEFERPATCEEVECSAWANGWVTRVPFGSDLEQAIRAERGRRPWTSEQHDGTTVAFTYTPGTPCFRAGQHRRSVRPDMPQLFVVRDGDWRGNPTGRVRRHTRPEDWVEHLQENTSQVAERIERG